MATPKIIDFGNVEVADNITNRFDFDTSDGEVGFVNSFIDGGETNQMVSLSAELGIKGSHGNFITFHTLNPQKYLADQSVDLPIGDCLLRLKPHIKQ